MPMDASIHLFFFMHMFEVFVSGPVHDSCRLRTLLTVNSRTEIACVALLQLEVVACC